MGLVWFCYSLWLVELKKKKEEELGFLSVFCLAGKLKGLYYDCSSKKKETKN